MAVPEKAMRLSPPSSWLEWLARVRYRLRQFRRGWGATISAADHAEVERLLTPAGAALFARMPADAQAHSLRVLHSLQAAGDTPPDLAAAALLHDVGKAAAGEAGVYLGLWLRGPLVLLEAWRPDLLVRWAAPRPEAGLRYAFYVQQQHPQMGADWARAAGCSELTCWLIAHHQEQAPAPYTAAAKEYLARLQWADGRN